MEHKNQPGLVLRRLVCPGLHFRERGRSIYLLDFERVFVSCFDVVSSVDASRGNVAGILRQCLDSRVISAEWIGKCINRSSSHSNNTCARTDNLVLLFGSSEGG